MHSFLPWINTRNRGLITLAMVLFYCGESSSQALVSNAKPRIVITADPELDDNNSMIRFLLYSNELQVEGLIYASSGYHWKGDGKGSKWYVPGREYNRFGLDTCPCSSWRWAEDEKFIHDIVDAYANSYPNLKIHDSAYPKPEVLQSKIRYGNIEFDGDISKDSPGSTLIEELIMDNKPGQLFLAAWGGQSTIARALLSIQLKYEYSEVWTLIREKIYRKVVLLPSGDQDDTYASYIKPNWPGIEYRQFTGGPNYGYGAQLGASEKNAPFLAAGWMKKNISELGPLGALYRVWGDGKQMVKGDPMDYFGLAGYSNEELKAMGYIVWLPVQAKGSWLGEGDDHTFMNMLGNGLRAYEDANYGGWGGYKIQNASQALFSTSSSDTSAEAMAMVIGSMNNATEKQPIEISFPDFFVAAQRDFAARMKWTVTSNYKAANHPPQVELEGPQRTMVTAGQKIKIAANISDPDGNKTETQWFQLPAGTYGKALFKSPVSGQKIELTIPADAKPGETIHLIVAATDNGSPALTSYQRLILIVK